MDHLLETDDTARQRELTLSTGSILALFLGLVLLCGLFFGLGYNLGSHKSPSAAVAPTPAAQPADAAPAANFNSFRPAAAPSRTKPTPADQALNSASSSEESAPSHASTSSAGAHTAASPIVTHPPAAAASSPATSATGSYIVQVAAVSHQEDADLLVSALKGRGYHVVAHAQPDNLIHIQIGPYATKPDADAMKLRLQADGYNAIVK